MRTHLLGHFFLFHITLLRRSVPSDIVVIASHGWTPYPDPASPVHLLSLMVGPSHDDVGIVNVILIHALSYWRTFWDPSPFMWLLGLRGLLLS